MTNNFNFKSILRTIIYTGNSVICPCCGGHFRRFLPMNKRDDVRCPKCESLERQRSLWLYLKNKTNILTGSQKVLHFAPVGPERIIRNNLEAMPGIVYVGADLKSPEAPVKMDITNIKYPDNYFDVILCVHVLEHVIDDLKAMKELFRVLKPNGWAIILAPIDASLEKTLEETDLTDPKKQTEKFGMPGHIRIYGKDYKEKLEKAGFNVRVDTYIRDLGSEKLKKYGLNIDDDMYYCTK